MGGKGGRCVGLTSLPPSIADCLENPVASNSYSPQGLSRTCGRIASPFCLSRKKRQSWSRSNKQTSPPHVLQFFNMKCSMAGFSRPRTVIVRLTSCSYLYLCFCCRGSGDGNGRHTNHKPVLCSRGSGEGERKTHQS